MKKILLLDIKFGSVGCSMIHFVSLENLLLNLFVITEIYVISKVQISNIESEKFEFRKLKFPISKVKNSNFEC